MKDLPIHEVFHTFQGEGVHMGKPAFFIRTFGCPVHCPFCDSAGTWHPSWIPKGIVKIQPKVLAEMALESGAGTVVITGGEPCVHDLFDLVKECHGRDLAVHLETSGAYEIKGDFDWITLSPKKWKTPLPHNLLRADEFKIIVETASDIPLYTKMLEMRKYEHSHVWLHPEWSQRENPEVLNAISDMVKAGNGHFRAGWQLHKLYKVDALDSRSAKLVPLGGDETKGY